MAVVEGTTDSRWEKGHGHALMIPREIIFETKIRVFADEANPRQTTKEEELMPRAEMEQVVGKAVMDPEFRKRFLADPEQAALDEGIQLTAAEVGALKTLDMKKFEDIGEDIDKSVAESPWYS